MRRRPSKAPTPTIAETITINADQVEALEEEVAPKCFVHGIYFGQGDPEADGEHWNFCRMLGSDDDEGVCTVQEIQRSTVYGGIAKFVMTRDRIVCEFDEPTSKNTWVRRLDIRYHVDAATWARLAKQARLVFQGEPYFDLSE